MMSKLGLSEKGKNKGMPSVRQGEKSLYLRFFVFTSVIFKNFLCLCLYSFHKNEQAKGPYKRTQQVTTLFGPTMLGVVGTCCVVHANKRNNCQHCWCKVVSLALITALSVPGFSSIYLYRPSHDFSSNNSLYLTHPRGKSFSREGQSAVPPRGLTIFWRRRFHEANIVVVSCKRAQHCCATLGGSQNDRNVGTCCAKSLTGFKLYVTSANIAVVPCKRTQQVTTLLAQQCCVRLHGAQRGASSIIER